MTERVERRVRRARIALGVAALAGAMLASGCAGETAFTANQPVALVVLQLDDRFAGQSSLSATIIGYDETFDTLINQSPSGLTRMSTASASDLGPFYTFAVLPGTYVIRDVSAGGQAGRCFAEGSIAFDVRAGTATFIGEVSDASAASTGEYRFATLAHSEGDMAAATAAFAEALKSKVPLAAGGDPAPVTFDLRRTAGDAVGNSCRRALAAQE